jgi:glycosyltransferase involved in cell wall biosynthesis
MQPLVSILIPAHNAELWIAETIQSALSQTWPRKEIIVVDDGSTDQTLQIARSFQSSQVRVVSQSNLGAAAARNHAFTLSAGDYIQWLDADDLLGAEKLSRQVAALETCSGNRTLLSGPWGKFYYRTSKARFVPSPLWSDLTPAEFLIHKMGGHFHMQTSTWLVSREITESAGPWDIRLSFDDDGEYFCRIKLASDRIRFVPEAKVYYRNVGTRRLSYIGHSRKKMESQLLSMKLHVKYLLSLEESPRTHCACLRYINNWLIYFYPGQRDLIEELERMAKHLGGALTPPALSWKYSWIKALFGWERAKTAQLALRSAKSSLLQLCDRTLYQCGMG